MGAFLLVVVIVLIAASSASATQTVVTVTTTGDSSHGSGDTGDCLSGDDPSSQQCSLRQAVAAADSDSSITEISLPAGSYKLSKTPVLDIEHRLSLVGAAANTTKITQTTENPVLVLDQINAPTVTIQGVTLSGGHVVGGLGGGGIEDAGTLTLIDSVVTNNKADGYMSQVQNPGQGGGISDTGGSLTLIDSTVSGNTAEPGAGSGSEGGGIYSEYSVTLFNSTVSGNDASSGYGGGIYLYSGNNPSLTIDSTTIASNTATDDGGNIYVDPTSGMVTSSVRDSIIAYGNGAEHHFNCGGRALTSQGYNIDGTGDCGLSAPSDVSNVNPMLGQLSNNGGPTPTMALEPGSPAINGGNPAGCLDPDGAVSSNDQRGVTRPQGRACDIGAFEFQDVTLKGTLKVSGKPIPGQRLTCVLPTVVSPDGPATTAVSWLRGTTKVGAGATYIVKRADQAHSLSCRVLATNAAGSASATSAARPVAFLPTVTITFISVNRSTVHAEFKAQHATGTQCALAKGKTAPRYSACHSPKNFTGVAKGTYTLYVRATGAYASSAVAKRSFSVG